VRQVVPGAPADKVGIQPGDVVLTVNGKPVEGAVELRRTLAALKPGSSVILQVNRRGKLMEFKPNLAELNPQVAVIDRPEIADQRTSVVAKVWGLTVANLTEAERQAARGVAGVRVTAVAAGAEAVGMRVGDVILAVGTDDTADTKQFDAVVSRLDKTRSLPVTVLRGEWAQFLRIPVVK
jgi:serine protease Do